ncbi:hypothetical protein VTJ49DRAFT_929 [Mycothermus thermophilus]|uniref:Mannosyl-3-phosphoglycerate synthase n=1 Tax=Humicola insolens TaxID=85995 RepID=A0ABR3VDY0_HUMIN
MRLTLPDEGRRFGLLHIFPETRVVELDTAFSEDGDYYDNIDTIMADGNSINTHTDSTVNLPRSRLDAVLSETVIVVPCKDEEMSVIRGVLAAIPPPCLIIIVSNCDRPTTTTTKDAINGTLNDDPYAQLVALARRFGTWGRQVMVAHQKDREAAAAFRAAGIPELLDDTDLIRNGKGEGMLLGIALAAAFAPERRYIGFVDADNFYAGSVSEYCRAFAAGFAMAGSDGTERGGGEDTMVRLRWASKPKVCNGRLEFVSEGRCSRIVNSWLNMLFSLPGLCGGGDKNHNPLITTGNAGEHAMTLSLAMQLRMAAGYAIEPFHFIDILTRGGLAPDTNTFDQYAHPSEAAPPLTKPVRILQIRTLSPHFHRASDDAHVRRMWAVGLGSVYHGLATFQHNLFHRRFSTPITTTTTNNSPHTPAPNCITPPPTRPSTPTTTTTPVTPETIANFRSSIHAFAADQHTQPTGTGGILDATTGELPRPMVYPPLAGMDLGKFREVMLRAGAARSSLRGFRVAGLQPQQQQQQAQQSVGVKLGEVHGQKMWEVPVGGAYL